MPGFYAVRRYIAEGDADVEPVRLFVNNDLCARFQIAPHQHALVLSCDAVTRFAHAMVVLFGGLFYLVELASDVRIDVQSSEALNAQTGEKQAILVGHWANEIHMLADVLHGPTTWDDVPAAQKVFIARLAAALNRTKPANSRTAHVGPKLPMFDDRRPADDDRYSARAAPCAEARAGGLAIPDGVAARPSLARMKPALHGRHKKLRDIARPVQNADDLDRTRFGPVDDEVGIHKPETERFVGEVLPEVTQAGTPRELAHGFPELYPNPRGCLRALPSKIVVDFQ